MSDNRQRTLAALDEVAPVDTTDRITVAALREDLELRERLRAAGENESHLSVILSPLQTIRDTFDLNPTDTVEQWAIIAARLKSVPTAVTGYISSLRYAAERGHISAQRQLRAGAEQCHDNVGPDGFWAKFVDDARTTDGEELPAALRADLDAGARGASEAYDDLARFLADELLPQSRDEDAVGRDRYELHSQFWLGSRVDLDEAYMWGQEFDRGRGDRALAQQPGAHAARHRRVAGVDAAEVGRGRRRAGRRALRHPRTGPVAGRPGRMWWSVPKGVTEFAAWRELTTVYHEGVPGHHLQIAQTAYRRDVLNRWRRQASWVSGHGEGWALYAERLMAELGFLDDPADYLGMLDAQSMRAARVVLDIGIHCHLPAPAEVGGGEWTYDKAWQFFSTHVHMNEGFRRFELDRYLGWPGQAPSYKLGERMWLQLRDEARAHEGDAFDLKAFHRRALDIGSVGLDVLRAAILRKI
jgi:uncharacterized protein (DUF885 family)